MDTYCRSPVTPHGAAAEDDAALIPVTVLPHAILSNAAVTKRSRYEKRYEALFGQAAVGICCASLTGILIDVNQKLCDMLGYTRGELLGLNFLQITHPDDVQISTEFHDRICAEGPGAPTSTLEKRYIRKDGAVIWASLVLSIVRTESGHPDCVLAIVQDVSSLRSANELLRATFEQAAVGIVRTDLHRNIIDANRKFCEMTGYSRSELLHMGIKQISHPEDLRKDVALRAKLLSGAIDHFQSEKRYVRKDGNVIWVRRTTSLARDGADGTPHYIIVVEDVTGRKAAEESYRASFDNAPTGIMHCTVDRRILRVNRKLCDMLGYTQDELLSMSTADILPPEHLETDRPKYVQQMLRGEMQSFSSERPFIRKDGTIVWTNRTVALVSSVPSEDPYFLLIIEDISQRKHDEAVLQDTRNKLKTAIESTNVGLWEWDLATGRVIYSREWKSQLGYADEEIGDRLEEWERLTHPEDVPKTYALIQRYLAGPWPNFEVEFRMRHKDGSWRWILSKATVHTGKDGTPQRMIGGHIDITARKQAEQELRESEQRFRALFNYAGVGISMRPALDRTLPWIYVNDHFCALLGYTRDELLQLNTAAITHPEEQSVAVRDNTRLLRGEIASYAREKRLLRKDGTPIWVILSVSLLPDSHGRPAHFMATYQDISERKRAQEALQESEGKFHQLANNIPQMFWITDNEQKAVIYASPAYETITGRPVAELESTPASWLTAVHAADVERVKHARKTRAPLGEYDIEFRIVHQDGSIRWIRDRAFPIRNAAGEIYRIAGISDDITQRKHAEQRLVQLAHFDALTGLPNRVLLQDRLQQMLAQAQRNGWTTGVLFIDLDRFKMVNDTLGHTLGDQLLLQVSERITHCVRTGDTVGRLGGDEFAVILSRLAAAQDAGLVSQKILEALNALFMLEGHEVFVSASIGITLCPDDSENIDILVRNADAAMYSAKEAGRSTYRFFTPDLNRRAVEKMQLETSLRRALERNEFVLHYQPKVNLASGEICGLEALLRWHPPENGLVSPCKFIPLLEESGLIVPVGEWVVREACAQIRAWRENGVKPVTVAVNVSARQLQQPGFDVMLARALRDYSVDARWLEVEITESSIMDNPDEAGVVLDNLGRLGVSLSIDDFGTGYSSLSRLKRIPLDALKIDASFVRDLATDPEDAAITRSVVALAHSLNLKVVAEGVETEEQLAFLRANRCDEAQGYLFSPPLPAANCTALLRDGRNAPALARGFRAKAAVIS